MYVLLIIGMLLGLMGPLYSGQRIEPVVINVQVELGLSSLLYIKQEDVNECNKYNMNAQINSPYWQVYKYSCVDRRVIPENEGTQKAFDQSEVDEITCTNIQIAEIYDQLKDKKVCKFIPWECLVQYMRDDFCYKKQGAQLFSFSEMIRGKNIEFNVCLQSDFKQHDPIKLINHFKTSPNYSADAKDILIKENIIIEENGIIKHGPNSYFSQRNMFFSTVRVVLGSVIFLCILYKLFMIRSA